MIVKQATRYLHGGGCHLLAQVNWDLIWDRSDYQTKTILATPVCDKDGKIVAVLQAINKLQGIAITPKCDGHPIVRVVINAVPSRRPLY